MGQQMGQQNGQQKGQQRELYQIVARWMDGKKVIGYQLLCLDNMKRYRRSKEQVVFLVGRGQITNCTGQLYNDGVLLRGKGVDLEQLPKFQANGELTNTENLGRIRRGTSAEDAVNQLIIVGRVKNGRSVSAYVLQNVGGGRAIVTRDEVIERARRGEIGNARVQRYNGELLLKGVNCSLDQLPIMG